MHEQILILHTDYLRMQYLCVTCTLRLWRSWRSGSAQWYGRGRASTCSG